VGIALEEIEGTGPAGRITLGDVERAVADRDSAPAGSSSSPTTSSIPPPSGGRLEPLSATRQAIARRRTESQLVPQYTLRRDIDAGWLLAEKTRLSDAGPAKVGVVDLLVQALAETLRRTRSSPPPSSPAPTASRPPCATPTASTSASRSPPTAASWFPSCATSASGRWPSSASTAPA
jgi:hypothetical protein